MRLVLVILLLPILLLPLLLPVVAFLEARERRQRQHAARRFACVHCGTVLGPAALDRADAAWREEWAERQKRHPNVKWRVVRRIWAVCGTCGGGYDFTDGAFHAVIPDAVSELPEAAPAPAPRARQA